MSPLPLLLHLAVVVLLPWPLVGLVNRTKAAWGGRRGASLWQPWRDVKRLLGKQAVYSQTTTFLFQLGPLVLLGSTLVSALLVPVLGGAVPLGFEGDLVALAYLWGIGRLALVLSALDTGSPFEGMGAAREMSFGAVLEPVLFLALGSLAALTGHTSLATLLHPEGGGWEQWVVTGAAAMALFVTLTAESARVPVDDPQTHLELTMIHEVMVLDHSGPELAAIQTAAALKLTLAATWIAALLNPFSPSTAPFSCAGFNLAAALGLAVVVGTVESLMARLRMRAIPQYLLFALFLGLAAVLAVAFSQAGFE